jgi:hypothetical protein
MSEHADPACDATIPVGGGRHCHGWLARGWPWHGCHLTPGHGRTSLQEHECACGHTWRSRRSH